MKRKFIVFMALSQLTACAHPDTNKLPSDLDRSPTLRGVDGDANGVRDDIDAYAISHYPDKHQRMAVLQGARSLQRALLVEPGDVIQAKRVVIEQMRAIRCTSSTFPQSGPGPTSHRVNRELESLTTNTRQRLEAYLAFAKTLDGTSWTLPTGDTCK